MSKLSDSRTAKNIYNKGNWQDQLYPSIRDTKPHIYLNMDNLVRFNPDLIDKDNNIKSPRDFVEFFKNFNP